jgi:hypothetical protein
MTKRRRSSSAERGSTKESTKKKSPTSHINPLLPEENDDITSSDLWKKRSAVLDQAIALDELSKVKTISTACIPHVTALLAFLNESSTEHELSSLVVDVALLILPWCIRCILSSTIVDKTLSLVCWEGLCLCLERLFSTEDPSTQQKLSQSVLSQSNLHKLVPRVTLAAVSVQGDAVALLAARSLPILLAQYHPSVEIACQSILSLSVQGEAACDSVTLMIVQWIASMVHAANPKTIFQLFSSRIILVMLSNLYFGTQFQSKTIDTWQGSEAKEQKTPLRLAINQLLSVGLFDPKHHMDGLCSLLSTIKNDACKEETMENSFQCYQQKLLTTIAEGSLVTDEKDTERANTVYLAMIYPVLLEAFFGASKAWDQVKATRSYKKKSSASERLGRVQFAMFRQVVASLQQLLNKHDLKGLGAGVDAIRMCITILLQFEVYLPSHDDQEASQFRFLEQLAQHLLGLDIAREPVSNKHIVAPTLIGLRTLVLLDHRLFNDRLVVLFTFCLGCDDVCLASEVVKLLATVADVYRQLRQQGIFFEALIELLDTVTDQGQSGMNLALLNTWLSHELAERSIADAIESCPFGQVQHLFSVLRSHVGRHMVRSGSTKVDKLLVLVTLAVLVLRNVRVERDNASEVSTLCHDFVRPLATDSSNMSDDGPKRKAVLVLCAWCMDLNTRASFWTGHSSQEVQIPNFLLETPRSNEMLANEAKTQNQDTPFDDGLILLLGHRLRELHGLIYESERIDTHENLSVEENTDGMLLQEAITIAAKIAEIAQKSLEEKTSSSQWPLVAKYCLSSWIPYASEDHIDWMLTWLFKTMSTCEDAAEVSSILSDASFYEYPLVTSRLADVAMQVTDCFVQQARSYIDQGTATEDSSLKNNTIELYLCRAAVPVRILNGIFRKDNGFAASLRHTEVVNSALNLDEQVWSIARVCSSAIKAVAPLCESLRHFAASRIKSFSSSDARRFLEHRSVENEVSWLRQSVLIPSICEPSLVNASGSLAGQLLRIIRAGDSEAAFRTVICNTFQKMGSSAASAAISRFLITELSYQHLDDRDFVKLIFKKMWNIIVELGGLDMENPAAFNDTTELYFLFGDLLRFARAQSISDCWSRPDIKDYLENKCIASLATSSTACAQYVVASLAQTDPSAEISRRIVEHIIVSCYSTALMDAVFSRLINHMNEVDLHTTLDTLVKLSKNPSKDTTNQIRLIAFCLQCTDEALCSSVLTVHAQRVFSVSLSTLVKRPVEPGPVLASCTVLDELLCSRRIMTLRDVDLTRLLFHISAAVGHYGPSDEMAALPTHLFTACTKLFITVFQRYTKYLYACAPLVILVVQAFLARVLYEQHLTDAIIADRAQRVARVCELFVEHSAIYKKHLIGLILEYIHSVQKGLSLMRKTSLLPAVYLLLDALSPHELKQLNVVMDPSATILFKGIYHNYQKIHAYKGK